MKGTSRPRLVLGAALLALGAGACDAGAPAASRTAHGLLTTALYTLIFDGATVAQGSVDDPPTISKLAAGTSPAFDAAIGAPRLTADAARAAVARRVASYFLPYAFDALPDAGALVPQNHVVLGGASADLTPSPGALIAGLAPLDCGDLEPRNLGWVFAGELPPAFGGLLAVSSTAAHELGHMLGLEHTRDVRDVMYAESAPQQAVPDLFALRFGAGEASITGEVGFRCSLDPTIDNHQRLLDRLGASVDRGPPPTLAWSAPLAGDAPATVAIVADATAADGPVLIEVWRNFELYAELTAPPYELALPLAATVTFVTLDAFAANGTHTSETRRFVRTEVDLAVPTDAARDLRAAVDLGGRPPDESCACDAAPRAPSWSTCLIIWSIYLTSRARRRRRA